MAAAGDLTSGEVASIYAAAASTAPRPLSSGEAATLKAAFGARVSLLPHQTAALAWMVERDANGGGVLADAPGLGKTLTCLALIALDRPAPPARRDRKRPRTDAAAPVGPTLVVAPTPGVRDQWRREAARFLDRGAAETVAVYAGAPADADDAAASAGAMRRASIVLADLGTVRKERHFRSAELSSRHRKGLRAPLYHVAWRRVIVDEVQDVEGRSLGADVAAGLPADARWGVSGTPVAVLESINGRRPAWDIFKPLYLAQIELVFHDS